MSDSPPNSLSGSTKKKSKKKKRKGGLGESDSSESLQEQTEKYPKQTSDQEEPVLTTTKCTFCGKSVRQLVKGTKNDTNNRIITCEACLKLGIPSDSDIKTTSIDGYVAPRGPVKENLCNCAACVSKRENAVPPEVEREAHITQSYWMEIRHVVRCIYRDSMNLSDLSTRENIGSLKMRSIVKKLCSCDPHQFFQRLETLAREYLLEVKVRLLEQLSCGFNSPQLAIEFIQMLLDEYTTLCSSLPGLLYLLEPLESTDYVKRLGVTIELVNKNIFRELIFAESFMSSNLPLIIAQLRLASLSSDPFHRITADTLSQSYICLDQEMEEIGKVWRIAREQLRRQHQEIRKHEERQREHRQAIMAKMKAEGEMIRKGHLESDDYATEAIQATTTSLVKLKEKQEQETKSIDSSPPLQLKSLMASSHGTDPPGTSKKESDKTTSSKEKLGTKRGEMSKVLFKCIKPIGDPEFRITDDIATHTITLKIDMTSVDLRHAEALCTREQVRKYEALGLRREEITEVALKLNAIKHLGINLRIDDLFDEHGFMVVDSNEVREEREDAVYFVEEGRNSIKGKERLIQEELARSELIDLALEKEIVVSRGEPGAVEGRDTDLLQSMTMKIRFMKSVVNEELRSRLMSDSEQVMFESCDQVQMKLTQLELNTVRLMCASSSLAANLGMINKSKEEGSGSYVNTDAPFVDLLLEQGKEKPADVIGKEVVKKQQEVSLMHPSEPTPLFGFPMTLPIRSQNCHCFACIGAVAAQQTEGISRPLNPIDPSRSQLTIKDVLIAGLEEDATGLKTDPERDINKVSNRTENLWQNWMSSTTNPLPEEGHTNTSNSPAAPPLSISTTDTTNTNTSSSSSSTASSTSNTGTADATTSSTNTIINHTHSVETSSTALSTDVASTNDGDSNNNGGSPSVRRYCPCCYCELFGNNSSITAPTSHNYTKQRDKMRQKLEKKRSKKDGGGGSGGGGEVIHQCPHGYRYPVHSHTHDHYSSSSSSTVVRNHQPTPEPPSLLAPPPTPPPPVNDDRSLDDLLRFIEGKDFNPVQEPLAGGKAKKKNKKKKTNDQLSPVDDTLTILGNGHPPTTTTSTTSTSTSKPSHLPPPSNGQQQYNNDNNHNPSSTKRTHRQEDKVKPPLSSQPNGSSSSKKVSPSPPLSRKSHNTQPSPKPLRNKKRSSHQSNGLSSKGYSERTTTDFSNTDRISSDCEIEEDYDQELEDFKKLCFSPAPVDGKKKLHVSLNMQDIISKMK